VTVAEALAGSLNVPAVKMAELVGVPELLGFLRSLGISTLSKDADHYGLALTL
jgi:penicillin-binding protein 1C